MMSNTQIPQYYNEFRDNVLNGSIPICKEISMEMYRIDKLIENPDIYYDQTIVDGFIKFCEKELTLVDGSDVKLLYTFKLWAEQLLGWYYFVERDVYCPEINGGMYVKKRVKKRLVNKQYIIVSRGTAKSLYESFIQSYFLIVDRKTTSQITVAPTMKQANEVIIPIATAITRARGPVIKFMTNILYHKSSDVKHKVKLASTKKGIENFITGSILEIRPMSINKLQGLRPKVSTIDEWLSGDLREDVIGAIEQGACKIDDYAIIAVSSEGTVRNGSGDTIKMELNSILKGEYINPHVSIFHYKLDNIEEVGDPRMWVKASPTIGTTVQYDAYHLDVERMTKAPSTRNDILAKRFGIPVEGFTYYFSYDETIKHAKKDYDGCVCSIGADLSQGDDLCSFTFMFPLQNGSFGVKTRNYITNNTFNKLPPALRVKYQDFINEGSLIIMDGVVLHMMNIYDDLINYIKIKNYKVYSFGYDPYNAVEFIRRWEYEYGPYGLVKVIQGARTESVPLGELKKLSEERMLLFDEELFSYTMGNCITIQDNNGNRKLYKKRREQKIDAVAALMDAYIAYKQNIEQFY